MSRHFLVLWLFLSSSFLHAAPEEHCPQLRKLRGQERLESTRSIADQMVRDYAALKTLQRHQDPEVQKRIGIKIAEFRRNILRSDEYEALGDLIFPKLYRVIAQGETRLLRQSAVELYHLLGPTSEFALQYLRDKLRRSLREFRSVRKKIDELGNAPLPAADPQDTLISLIRILPDLGNRSEKSAKLVQSYFDELLKYRSGPAGSQRNRNTPFVYYLSRMDHAVIESIVRFDWEDAAGYLSRSLGLIHNAELADQDDVSKGYLPLSYHYGALVALHGRKTDVPRSKKALFDLIENLYRHLVNSYRMERSIPGTYWATLNAMGAFLLQMGGPTSYLMDASEHLFNRPRWNHLEFVEASHYVRSILDSGLEAGELPAADELLYAILFKFSQQLRHLNGEAEQTALGMILTDLVKMGQSQKPQALKLLLQEMSLQVEVSDENQSLAVRAILSGNNR